MSVVSDSLQPHRRQPSRLHRPWDSPARTLEWVAIAFSSAWKGKVKGKSLSRAQLFATPWTTAYQAPPSMGFPRQEYWSGLPLPSPNKELLYSERNSTTILCKSLYGKVSVLVTQLCPDLCNFMDYTSPPGSSVHGVLQAKILEWIAILFSRGSSQPRDWTLVSCIAGGFFTLWATRETLIWENNRYMHMYNWITLQYTWN